MRGASWVSGFLVAVAVAGCAGPPRIPIEMRPTAPVENVAGEALAPERLQIVPLEDEPFWIELRYKRAPDGLIFAWSNDVEDILAWGETRKQAKNQYLYTLYRMLEAPPAPLPGIAI